MIELFFSQYKEYSNLDIFLEIVAVFFGLASVWFARKDNILVFPTGIVSTVIFIYLLWKWQLFGDMSINFYYTVMSIYGWYHWTRKKGTTDLYPIARITKSETIWAFFIFVVTLFFVVCIYDFFDKFTQWSSYVDTLTTGFFFVGMWLMAKRKIEHWIFWIIGDVLSVPLYYFKGYTFTSLQYLIFTIIAIFGYIEWKKTLNNSTQV